MSFLARVMRFLFWLLVLSWSVTLLRRAIAWMLRGAAMHFCSIACRDQYVGSTKKFAANG